MFNKQITFFEKMSSSSIASSPFSQKPLSSNVDGFQFQQLIKKCSLADVFSKHAASWLSVAPSKGLSFHHTAVKWWLGLDYLYGSLCPGSSLDSLGHHATTCKRWCDAIFARINFETSWWNPSTMHICWSRWIQVQDSAQTFPSQDRWILLYTTGNRGSL